jgi:hypothetical protein
MAENFTAKQKEIIARKLGYDGPMQGFDDFLNSSPALGMKYATITDKFATRMAKGGLVKNYQVGGLVPTAPIAPLAGGTPETSVTPTIASAPVVQATTTSITPEMMAQAQAAGEVTQAATTPMTDTAQVAAPTTITAPTVTAAQATPAVSAALQGVQAEQGTVSQQAQVGAVTQAPTTTAIAGLEAAQGQAAQVAPVAERTAQAGEMVAGPAVDMAKVDTELAKTQAAQGVVSEEMTTQGQLNKLLTDFDAGAPPPWAAASLRTATAQLAARGLGASSLAGQAIIQATLEAATPIAAADAKVFEQMGLQNLSNRQQVAMLVGQQRAQFLGQEFDQAFQTRVMNAAKISDIANRNFDAQTTIALENARLSNTMNISNLSAKNAMVMAKAAQMAQLETTNLNNRQQAAVVNAQNFLQMDMKNVDLKQQTAMFKAQEISDAIVSDASFENATRATNAANAMDAAKVSATLALTAEQFNANEQNKTSIANMAAANEIAKFNAAARNQREEFNANMSTQINVANAKILADVSTANTAAVNAANAVNAKNYTDLSAASYAQVSQTYRDLLEMSWKTGESEKDRVMEIAKATMVSNADIEAAKTTASTAASGNIGAAALKALENDKVWNLIGTGVSAVTGLFKDKED